LDNYKTIKELADELEYSKQTIQKIIEGLSPENKPKKKGNRYILSLENQNQIKQILGIDILNNETNILNNISDKKDIEPDKSNKNEYIEYLISESDIKNKRIEILEKLLDQQQQLTLQSNKQIEQLQNQLRLMTPLNNETEIRQEKVVEEDDLEKEVQDLFSDSVKNEDEKSGMDNVPKKTISFDAIKKRKKWWEFWK